jgi:membrane protease YdiL (CAAX protease family)
MPNFKGQLKLQEKLFFVFIAGFSLVKIALLQKIGWIFLGLAVVSLFFTQKRFKLDMGLILISMFLLGITPISTDVSILHMLAMGIPIALAIILPYRLSIKLHGDDHIRIPFRHQRNWKTFEIVYFVAAIILAYFLLPSYWSTGPAHNWTVELTTSHLVRLFIGINGLVILEEILFFGLILNSFLRWIHFHWANFLTAFLFTTFLYQLGFTGFWGPFLIFPFTLAQGYAFRYTGSLLYLIIVHVLLDIVLFASLIHAHHPAILNIFLVS